MSNLCSFFAQVTVNVGLSLAVLVDVVITAFLIYYLGRRSSSFSRCVLCATSMRVSH